VDERNPELGQENVLSGASTIADRFASCLDDAPIGPQDMENCCATLLGRMPDRDSQLRFDVGVSQLLRELLESGALRPLGVNERTVRALIWKKRTRVSCWTFGCS